MEKELISILLIEDNATDVILLREALEEVTSFSLQLTVSERLEQGLKLLSEEHFEAILLDLGLPDSQELDTFNKVHNQHPDIPIIVLSGMEDERLAFEAVQAGAQDYMVKGKAGGESIARATRYAIERQRSKAALRASEDRFRSLFEHSPVAYQSLDSEGIYIDVNEQLCEMLGYEREDLLGKNFSDLWSPEIRSTFPRKFARFKHDGEMDTEAQLIKKDGNVIEVVLEGKVQYDLNGQVMKTHCILHDITERVLAEQAIRESQERFGTVFRASPISIFITTTDEMILDVNEAFLDMFGYKRSQVLSRSMSELNLWHVPQDRNQLIKLLGQKGTVSNHEIKYRTSNGEIGDALAFVELIELAGKQCLLIMLNDVTEHIQAELDLRSTRKFLQGVQDSLSAHIAILDHEGVICQVNDAWREFGKQNGYGHPDLGVGLNYLEVCDSATGPYSDEAPHVTLSIREILAGEQDHAWIEYPCHSEAEKRWFVLHITSFEDQDGRWAVLSHENITERKEAENAIKLAEEHFKALIENAPDGIVLIDAEGNFKYVSPSARRMFGYGVDEEIGIHPAEATHPDDLPTVLTVLDELVKKPDKLPTVQYRFRHKEGMWLWVEGTFNNLLAEPSVGAIVINFREITERKKAEAALLAAEQKYYSIFNEAIEGLFQSTPEGRFLTVNPALARLWGYETPEELINNITNIATQVYFDPQRRDDFTRLMDEHGEVHGFEFQARRKDGGVIRVSEDARAVKDVSGKLLYYEGFIQDITARKTTEERLKESEEKFSKAFYAHATAMQIIDLDNNTRIDLNKNFLEITGYTREELTHSDIYSLNLWKDPTSQKEAVKRLVKNGIISNYPMEAITKSGETKHILLSAAILELEGKNWAIESLVDITERKHAENKIQASEELYRGIFEGVQDAIFVETVDGDILDVNQRACEMYGYTRGEFLTKNVADLVPSHQEIIPFEKNHRNEHLSKPTETINVRANGEHFPVEITGGIFERGDQKMFLVVLRDITERKQAETALREGEKRLNLALTGAQMGVWEWNLQTNGIFWSPECFDITGISKKQFNGKLEDFTNLIHPEDIKQVIPKAEEAVKDKNVFEADFRITRPDGELRWLANFGQAEYDQAGEPLRLIGVVQDITERKQVEEIQRKNAQQFEALFETASDLAGEQDLSALLNTVVARTKKLFNTQVAGIYLYDVAQDELEMAAVTGYAVPIGTRLKFGEGMAGQVARTRKPLVIEDYRLWKGRSPQYEDFPFTSTLQVPMLYAGELIGVLAINEMAPNIRQFTKDDTRLLSLLASAAAGAVRSARLYKKTQQLSVFNENVLNYSPTGILTYKSSGECTYVNERAAEIVGASIEQLKSQNFRAIESWKQSGLLALAEKAIVTNEITTSDIHHYSTFGKEVWMTANCVIFKSEDDEENILLTITDITERKQATREIEQLKDFNESIVQTMTEGIVIENKQGEFTFLNPAACDLLGYSSEELAGKHWTEFIPPDQQPIVQSANERRAQGEADHYELEMVRKDGERISLLVSGNPRFDAEDNFIGTIAVFSDITEQTRAIEALRQSEERYRTLIDQIPSIVYIDDATSNPGRTQFVSPYIEKMLGFSPEEWIQGGFNFWVEHLHPQDRERVLDEYQSVTQDKSTLDCEYRLLAKDGGIVWVRDQATVLYDVNGKPRTINGVIHDITARKKADDALRESEQRFHMLFTTSPDAILVIDPHDEEVIWPIVDCNEAACEMNGYTREELIGQPIDILNTTPDTLEEHNVYLEQMRSEGVLRLEATHLHKDGHIFPIEVSSSIFTFEGRELVLGIDRDISERKQAEAEIERRVAELETLYENGLLISGLLDPRKIAKRIVEVLEQNLNWHHVAIRQYHEENDHLELLAFSQPNLNTEQLEQHVDRLNKVISSPNHGLSGWVIRHNKPIRSGNLSKEPNYVSTFPGLKSGLYVPIQTGGVPIGSIAVETEAGDAFTEQDERLLITLANQAAISFENAKLYTRLQKELSERRQAEEQIRKLNIELEQRVASRTAEIEAAHQRMGLAASAAGIGIWELKSETDSLFWDERMHELYGTSPVIFNPTVPDWLTFVYPDDRQMVEEKRAQAIEKNLPYESEFRIVRADGSLRHISSHAIVQYDKEHKFTDMIGVNLDITTIKQAEETLRMANMELERALKVKDEFLANMSHELRTPLNAILGLSESLEEQIAGPLNEKQQKYIHTIGESGHHLLTLINDILDLAKIEAGQIILDINKVNVHLVCQASIRMIKQLAQKKEQNVNIEINEKVNLIWADERRLKQMIVNLLSNAVKFTPHGGNLGINVDVEEAENTVMIMVWDTGIGIKDEDMERLFQPFVQLDASLDRESPGTGLGLALVAQMTRLHGGRITVDSTPSEGSRFTIILPWKPALHTGSLTDRNPNAQNPSPTLPAKEKQTILLVEDTDAVVMMLKDYLEKSGYHMIVARDGLEGIIQAKRLHPDLILMDVMMPGMDGLEATRKIRNEPDIADIPIIGLTALAMSSDRERCLAAGMNDYMSKPIMLNELVAVIQSHLPPSEENQPQ